LQTSSKRVTKLLGIFVLVLAAFFFYLAVANVLFWVGAGSIPLEGRLSRDLVLPLFLLTFLGLIIVNKRRRLESRQVAGIT